MKSIAEKVHFNALQYRIRELKEFGITRICRGRKTEQELKDRTRITAREIRELGVLCKSIGGGQIKLLK